MRIALVAILLTACTADDPIHHLPDARLPPDPTDAPPPPPVALTITFDGAAVAGIPVYFQGPDDALLATVATDATGRAAAALPAGGSVTVANPYASAGFDDVRTWIGVAPGDQLVLADHTSTDATIIVVHPDYPAADHYHLGLAGCGDYSMPGGGSAVDVHDCPATVDVALTAVDAADVPLASLDAHAMPATAGALMELSGTFAPIASATRAFTNIPADATSVAVQLGQRASDIVSGFESAAVDRSTGLATVHPTPIDGALAFDDVTVVRGLGTYELARWGSSDPIDLGGAMGFDAAPTYDLASRTVRWTGAASAATFVFVGVGSLRYTTACTVELRQRSIIAPFGGTHVTIPALPAALASSELLASDTIVVGQVKIGVSGDDYRAHGLDLHESRLDMRRWIARTPVGQVATVTYQRPPALVKDPPSCPH